MKGLVQILSPHVIVSDYRLMCFTCLHDHSSVRLYKVTWLERLSLNPCYS